MMSNETQLYVGDLPNTVTESDLFSLASQYGHVAYIRILRHLETRVPLGYAFINFTDPQQAKRAREELNGREFLGSHIRVMKVTRDRDPQANVFVKNLSEQTTAQDLEQLFKTYGPILSSKVSYDKNHKSRGYGFVQFEKREAAEKAIKEANGRELMDKTLQVEKFVPFNQRSEQASNRNLYVRGFGPELSADDLAKRFSEFGNVTSHTTMKSSRNGVERYFGFVCFEDAESANRAKEEMHGKVEGNTTWYVVPHMNKSTRLAMLTQEWKKKVEDWKKRNVFVKNLPKSIDENKMRELCSEYGGIDSIYVPRTKNIIYEGQNMKEELQSRGTACISFIKPEDTNKAVKGLKEKTVEGNKLLAFHWKPREELAKAKSLLMSRKQQQQSMMMMGMMPFGMPMGRGRDMMPFPFMPPPPKQPRREPPKPQPAAAQLPFSLDEFQKASPEIQKRMLGEALYPHVLKYSNQQLAGKITGMLLEMDTNSLLQLLYQPDNIKVKVEEAIEVLRKAWENSPDLLKTLPPK